MVPFTNASNGNSLWMQSKGLYNAADDSCGSVHNYDIDGSTEIGLGSPPILGG